MSLMLVMLYIYNEDSIQLVALTYLDTINKLNPPLMAID